MYVCVSLQPICLDWRFGLPHNSAMTDTSTHLPSRRRGGKEPRHTRHQLRKSLITSQGEVAALKDELASLQHVREQCSEKLVDSATGDPPNGKDGFATPPRRAREGLPEAKGLRTWGDVLVDEVIVTTFAGFEVLKVGTNGWTTSRLRMAVACALGKDHVFVLLADEQGRLLGDRDPIVSPRLTCIIMTESRR